jgi:hypothetical protein
MKLIYQFSLIILLFIYVVAIPGEVLADDQFSSFIITPEEATLLNLSDADWENWRKLSPGAGAHSEIPEMDRLKKMEPPGPKITIHKPQYVNYDMEDPILHSNSPVDLLVVFEKNEAPVDIKSLNVWAENGIIKKSLTNRLNSFIDGDTLNAESIKVPSGKFLLGISISDTDGRETRKKYRLMITNDDK